MLTGDEPKILSRSRQIICYLDKDEYAQQEQILCWEPLKNEFLSDKQPQLLMVHLCMASEVESL